MKTKSQIFTEAHKIARTLEGHYSARFILALEIVRTEKKDTRKAEITIKGNYGRDDKLNVKVLKTVYTGTGTLDYITTTIFKGTEIIINGNTNIISMSDEEWDSFEEMSINYFQSKYCKSGEELNYFVQ